MVLTPKQARAVYDRIGRRQEWTAFYEDAVTDRLVAHAALGPNQVAVEFGCGPGRLAERLMRTMPPDFRYIGVDLSPEMVRVATARLGRWADRADVVLVDGTVPLPIADRSADRVLSTFVFDLLDDDVARASLDDLRRIVRPDGLICLASLTEGHTPVERAVSRTWTGLWSRAPRLTAGCRPISVSGLFDATWDIRYRSTVHRFGLVSEIVVAAPRG